MSDDMQSVIMPDAEAMTQALIAVSDQPHMQEHFYPIICRNLAGKTQVAMGVVTALTLAIYDYTKGIPPMEAVITLMMPQLIAAVTPEEIRAEALELWELASAG